MPAATGQNFAIYAGDSAKPVITVTDNSGAVVDISGASEIAFSIYRSFSTAAVLTKLKSGGGVVFITNGTDGKFQPLLIPVDTATLSGNYVYAAKITDGAGNVATVTIGSMLVGPAPTWSYDAVALTGVDAYAKLMQVRTLIGDVNINDQQLFDEQINFAIAQRGNIYGAGADCCRQLAAKYSRDVDTTQGELHRLYSARQRAFADRAKELEQISKFTGPGAPYAGGISNQDKAAAASDPDRVPPQFVVPMMQNYQPVGPVQVQPTPSGGNNREDVW